MVPFSQMDPSSVRFVLPNISKSRQIFLRIQFLTVFVSIASVFLHIITKTEGASSIQLIKLIQSLNLLLFLLQILILYQKCGASPLPLDVEINVIILPRIKSIDNK